MTTLSIHSGRFIEKAWSVFSSFYPASLYAARHKFCEGYIRGYSFLVHKGHNGFTSFEHLQRIVLADIQKRMAALTDERLNPCSLWEAARAGY